MKLRKIVAGASLAIAFVINPACYETFTSHEPVWRYGEREMRNAVEGTWELTYTTTGETVRFTVAQSSHAEMALAPRGGLIATAHACGTRSLIRTAGACEDISLMPLDLVAAGHHFEKASLQVIGTEWDRDSDPELVMFRFTIDSVEVRASVSHADDKPAASANRRDDRIAIALRRIAR